MKKIYTIIGAIAITSSSVAQSNALYDFGTKNIIQELPTLKSPALYKNKTSNVAGGLVQMRVDPMYNVIIAKAGALGTDVRNVLYTNGPLAVDSLLKYGPGSDEYLNYHMVGLTFDAQSISQGPSFTSLFSKADPFFIDTLWFGGIYDRVTASSVVDDLIVDVTWADTTSTSVFTKWTPSAPLNKFGTIIAPRFAVATPTAHGLQARLANQANYIRYTIPLNVNDTDVVNNQTGYLGYKLPTPLSIPAGNKVAISYTFRSGATYTVGQIGYGPGQVVNSWNPTLYSQNPQPTDNNGVLDFFNDLGAGKNQGTSMDSRQRYATIGSGFVQTNAMFSMFSAAYKIDISLRGTSTVGVKELEKNGFDLGQNVPNPFSSSSTVKYQLVKDAKLVTFTLTDITGRIISSETVSNTNGIHSVTVSTLAAGVYYYSLNVDGNTVSKKMIAQ